jgi:hypothetical protein
MNDYVGAFKYYLQLLEDRVVSSIVFAENSNSDISKIRELAELSPMREQVELLSFDGLHYPTENGRGYGEMRLIDYAMQQSKIIAAAGNSTMVWKITGRYVIKNLARLLLTRPGADFYCHCRNVPKKWADMYLLGWQKHSYETLLRGVAEKVKESAANSWSAEHRFRECVDAMPQQCRIVKRFNRPPHIVGIRGWDNLEYRANNRAKGVLRTTLALLAPWVWI